MIDLTYDSAKASAQISDDWIYEDHAPGASCAKMGFAVRALEDFIKIPNLSPGFGDDGGELDRAARFIRSSLDGYLQVWASRGAKIDDIEIKLLGGSDAPVERSSRRLTPLVTVDVPAFGDARADGSVMLYGHLDKQPPLDDDLWAPFSPRVPAIKDGRLYGRGGADDGYSAYCSLGAVMALRAQNAPHARTKILIEASEESGSPDIDAWMEILARDLEDVSLIICADGSCCTYDRLWTASSLRGIAWGKLTVRVLDEGVHSGEASGVVPSPFRIMRALISRIEDERTGEVIAHALRAQIPQKFRAMAQEAIDICFVDPTDEFPFSSPRALPVHTGALDTVLSRTWRPQLAVIGMDGFPPTQGAGNVMLPCVTASLSFRLPPTIDSARAIEDVKAILEADPPYRADVKFEVCGSGQGWAAVNAKKWYEDALDRGSRAAFGAPAATIGVGSSIPFMGKLARRYPNAHFMITGVLGPNANAHGPREFLDINMARGVTIGAAEVIAAHAIHSYKG